MKILKWILYPLWLLVGEVLPIWLFAHSPTEATVLLFCGTLGIALVSALIAELGKLVDMMSWKVRMFYAISGLSTLSWYIAWFAPKLFAN